MHRIDYELAYQLLCACNLAYGIGKTQDPAHWTLVPVPPVLTSPEVILDMLSGSGLETGSLHTHQADERAGIDAFLYGETPETAVLAFRGTLPMRLMGQPRRLIPTLGDWINNAKAGLVDGRPFGLPGEVHAGFGASLDALWRSDGGLESLFPSIRRAIRRGKSFVVTGHSKGGALAGLAALRCAVGEVGTPIPDRVIMFAAPRSGDHRLAEAFERSFAERAWRFEYQNDIVPQLPPSANFWRMLENTLRAKLPSSRMGGTADAIVAAHHGLLTNIDAYESFGQLQFIDWNGRLISENTPELRTERLRRLTQALLTTLPEIGLAHLPMRGYGYMDFLTQQRNWTRGSAAAQPRRLPTMN